MLHENTAQWPSTQASYTASRVRPKRKISCAAAQIAATQIAATLTISFPRWRHILYYAILRILRITLRISRILRILQFLNVIAFNVEIHKDIYIYVRNVRVLLTQASYTLRFQRIFLV